MTRTPISTLKVRAAFTIFVSVILLTLFAILPRMVTGFSNYLNSGTSIFLPFMEPVNVLWFLPTDFQFLSLTLSQFADICIFACISHHIWAVLYHYYMKAKRNIILNLEMAEHFDPETLPHDGPIAFFNIGASIKISAINGKAQKSCVSMRLNRIIGFPKRSLKQELPINQYDICPNRCLRPLTKTRPMEIKSSLYSEFFLIKAQFLSNSAKNSPDFDSFIFAPPAWDSASNFTLYLCAAIGGTS